MPGRGLPMRKIRRRASAQRRGLSKRKIASYLGSVRQRPVSYSSERGRFGLAGRCRRR